MKILIGFIILNTLSALVLAADLRAESKKIVAACLQENGVSAQQLKESRSGQMKPEEVDDNIKCAAHCMMVKPGFMDANGNLQVDAIKKRFADTPMKTDVEKALNSCQSVKGSNPCESAFLIMNCMRGSKLDMGTDGNAAPKA